jgi:hypothetical protein
MSGDGPVGRRAPSFRLLLGLALVCGAITFGVMVWLSQLAGAWAEGDAGTASTLLVALVLCAVLLAVSIALGYVAARYGRR